MRIRHVEVKRLFGRLDHEIPFNLDDRVTIIHGPNGIGKTWILKLIAAALSPQISTLRVVPFASFAITFDDGRTLTVTKPPPETTPDSARTTLGQLTFRLQRGRAAAQVFKEPERVRRPGFPLSVVDSEIPELARTGPAEWRSLVTGEEFDLDAMLERYAERLPAGLVFEDRQARAKVPAWLVELRQEHQNRFIESERLFVTARAPGTSREYARRPETEPAVGMYAAELAGTIQRTLADYANIAQSLDRTFPSRVVGSAKPKRVAPEELRGQIEELDRRRLELQNAGLLDSGSADTVQAPAEIDDSALAILSVYVDDTRQKLKVLDELAAKTDLMKSTLDRRFRYKHVEINRERGLTVRAEDGRPLQLAALSSGEQHEIVLTYELLFRVRPSSLVLIDEPELSLHVAWQEAFLGDLLNMAELGQFDVVLATHSPQIIGDRWDLTVQLGTNGA